MIQKLSLKGFKSFVDETIELAPLTVLTGLNSSGKSSVIQAIRMFSALYKGKSALLDGHGGLQELRSRMADSMVMSLHFADGSEQFFNDGEYNGHDIKRYPTITYIGADRFGPQSTIPILNDNYEIGEKGDNTLNCLNYYSEHILDERLKPADAEGLTLEYMVKGWLKYISPNVKFDYKIDSKADISYGTYDGNRAANVGFGLSYTLPIIVALLVSTIIPGSVVLIENPEAHLHPKGQTEMGRLIGQCVECGAQVVVETHSDHLFDGLRIFTKHTSGFSKKFNAYWFERSVEEGSSVFKVHIDDDGRYDVNCPTGFFDQFEINAASLLF